jgi:hypothetical protein
MTPLLHAFINQSRKKGILTLCNHHIYTHDDGRRFIITDDGGGYKHFDGGMLIAYELCEIAAQQALIHKKSSELAPLRVQNGRFHGKLVKLANDKSYHVLVGPAVDIYVPSSSQETPKTAVAAPPKPPATIRNHFMT